MFFGRLACGHFAHPDFPTDYSNWNLCCEHRILYKIICMVLIFSPPDKKLNQQKLGAKPVIWCNSVPQSQLLNQPFWQSCFKTHHQVWKPEGRKLCFYKTSLSMAWGSFALLSDCQEHLQVCLGPQPCSSSGHHSLSRLSPVPRLHNTLPFTCMTAHTRAVLWRKNLVKEDEVNAGSGFDTGSGASMVKFAYLFVTSSHKLPLLFLLLKTGRECL